MHEWALAESVVLAAESASKKEKLVSISELSLVMGELQQMDAEAFRFALNEMMKEKDWLFADVQVNIRKEEAVFECRVCRHQWNLDEMKKKLDAEEMELVHFVPEAAHAYVRCEKCKSPDFRVIKGRGVWLDTITGERHD